MPAGTGVSMPRTGLPSSVGWKRSPGSDALDQRLDAANLAILDMEQDRTHHRDIALEQMDMRRRNLLWCRDNRRSGTCAGDRASDAFAQLLVGRVLGAADIRPRERAVSEGSCAATAST